MLWTTNHELKYELKATNYQLPTKSYELCAMRYKIRARSYEIRATVWDERYDLLYEIAPAPASGRTIWHLDRYIILHIVQIHTRQILLILPLILRYRHHTVQSLAGSACFYSKLIVRSVSFLEFSEFGWQIQLNCCKDAEVSFSFSCECVSLKLNIKQSGIKLVTKDHWSLFSPLP